MKNTTKKCCHCNINKSTNEFGKNKRTKDGLQSFCKECRTDRERRYWKSDSTVRSHKNARLKRMYGISIEQYEDMLEKQKGVCYLCGEIPKSKGLAVDHCHKTGKVRGLLCINCNTMLGKFERNPSLLGNMQRYLGDY